MHFEDVLPLFYLHNLFLGILLLYFVRVTTDSECSEANPYTALKGHSYQCSRYHGSARDQSRVSCIYRKDLNSCLHQLCDSYIFSF